MPSYLNVDYKFAIIRVDIKKNTKRDIWKGETTMEQKRMQNVLREQFGFRVLIFLVALLGCVGYGLYGKQAPIIWGIVLGTAASALVWASVELFDFFVSTYHQYCLERGAFILMVTGYWSKIRTLLSTDKNEICWSKIKGVVEELYAKTAQYPFSGGVYATSREFQDAASYITRMYWRVRGCFWNLDDVAPESCQAESLYDMFFVIENGERNGEVFLSDLSNLETEMEELRDVELSFEKFDVPKYSFKTMRPGVMWEEIDADHNTHVQWRFRPQADFGRKFGETPANGAVITVLWLIFRRITE